MMSWQWWVLIVWLGSYALVAVFSLYALGREAGPFFAVVQFYNWVAVPLGWVVLAFACLAHAWTAPIYKSVNPLPGRGQVDQWRWPWLNRWYANPEDGVSGVYARLNVGGPDPYRPYAPMPDWWPAWAEGLWASIRAYRWSAWRNSANQLKYEFRWADAPPAVQVGPILIGWRMENGFNVPVLERYP